MSAISDITLKSHLQGLSKPSPTPVSKVGGQFAEALKQSLSAVNQSQVAADRAAEQVVAGESRNLHDAMIKLEEADISMRLMVQVRNKAVEAYQEIMRMQV